MSVVKTLLMTKSSMNRWRSRTFLKLYETEGSDAIREGIERSERARWCEVYEDEIPFYDSEDVPHFPMHD